jgi:tetrahydromethanopterin S-methyltransferase subunit G
MISNLIRKALGPTLDNRFSGESIRLNTILNEMETALEDIKAIRASDIADNISTYDIAQDISIDAYDIANSIEIDASDIEVDTHDLADRIAREIGGDIDIDYSDLAREISDNIDLNVMNARINNVHTNLQTVERKMDLILKHLGITPENA